MVKVVGVAWLLARLGDYSFPALPAGWAHGGGYGSRTLALLGIWKGQGTVWGGLGAV